MTKTLVLPFQPLKSPVQKFEGLKSIRCQGPKMQLTLTQPDDWHLHLRDGDLLKAVLPHSASNFGRAIVMPNLKPPITTTAAAVAYRDSILKVLPSDSSFIPLMALYLTDTMSPNEIKLARRSGAVYAVKLYPAGATTNSQDGVTDLFGKCLPVLEEMVEQDMPLLVHGEVTNPDVDVFDREKVFIETVLKPLIERLPKLKVVMEHITTADAAKFVQSCEDGLLAATVTPQHLLLNRNSLFQGGLQPHNYCLPVLKRETHRQAIVSAVTSGSKKFFLGTDSAPHERRRKESSCGCAASLLFPPLSRWVLLISWKHLQVSMDQTSMGSPETPQKSHYKRLHGRFRSLFHFPLEILFQCLLGRLLSGRCSHASTETNFKSSSNSNFLHSLII